MLCVYVCMYAYAGACMCVYYVCVCVLLSVLVFSLKALFTRIHTFGLCIPYSPPAQAYTFDTIAYIRKDHQHLCSGES